MNTPPLIQIVSQQTGDVLYEGRYASVEDAAGSALAAGANLSGANLPAGALMRAALRCIADFPNDPRNRDLTFSEAVEQMAAIAQRALNEEG